MLLDLSPLKVSRDYRLLFFGQLVSFFGSMMTFIVVPWQMYQLTRSSAMVGYIYLAEFVPMVCLAFVGGALADFLDKRKMLRLTEIGQTSVTAILLANSLLPQPQIWVLVSRGRPARRICGDTEAGVRIFYSKSHPGRYDVGGDGPEFDPVQRRRDRQPGRRGHYRNAAKLVGRISIDLITFAASLCAVFLIRAVPVARER